MEFPKTEAKILESSIVTNFNATGLCQEETCDKRYTHYGKIEIFGMKLFIPLCEEHYKEFEESWLQAKVEEQTSGLTL